MKDIPEGLKDLRIVFDFGHPAHVHYFKAVIKVLHQNGTRILCFARDRVPVHDLLTFEGISFINRGKGSSSVLGKALYSIYAIAIIVRKSKRFRPHFLFSFGGGYISIAGYIVGARVVVLEDTETAVLNRVMGLLFTDIVITPLSFKRNLCRKQVRIPGTFDSAYLHPSVFSPDRTLISGVIENGNHPYVLVRFVSWGCHHDMGKGGMKDDDKIQFITSLSRMCKVYITSEKYLPNELMPYVLKTPPERIHHIMYYASVVIGESGTMATEAAVLGTPSILFLSKGNYGVFDHYERLDLLEVFGYSRQAYSEAIERIEYYLANSNQISRANRSAVAIESGIDVTAFLIDLVKNYNNNKKELLAGQYKWSKL